MKNGSILQVRLPEEDLGYLRSAANAQGASVSSFIRNYLEPIIVSGKIAALADSYPNIEIIVMFGSMARGDQTEASDIDLAMAFSEPPKWMGQGNLAEFLRNAEIATGRSVDYIPLRACPKSLVDDVLRDGKVVYERQA